MENRDVFYTEILGRSEIKPHWKEGQEVTRRNKWPVYSQPLFAHSVCPMYYGIYESNWGVKIYFPSSKKKKKKLFSCWNHMVEVDPVVSKVAYIDLADLQNYPMGLEHLFTLIFKKISV